ncbi:MAG: DUF5682 family protein [Candidatus Hodarchaeales archaeon]
MNLQLEAFDLDVEHVETLVDTVFNDELYYFPIRHHSPIAAYFCKRVIEERQPSIIFLELPSDLADLAPFVVDKDTQPPISFYSAFKDIDNVIGANGTITPSTDIPAKFQGWSPLVDYSPEYVVLKRAYELDIDLVFIDLPFVEQVQTRLNPTSKSVSKSRNQDYLWLNSYFMKEFALNYGHRTFNETWDSIFEIQGLYQDSQEFRRNLLLLAAAARSTIPKEGLEADATLKREQYMRYMIDSTLKAKDIPAKKALVVCGAGHAVALPTTQGKDVLTLQDSCTVLNSLIPFSYFSVSEFSGYGAGNRAPLYYEKIWKQLQKENTAAYRKLALMIISRAMADVRNKGEVLSTADVIAAFHSVQLLASLRKRRQPNIDDIRDALLTVCVKGDSDVEGKNILDGLDRYLLGTRVGKVTRKLGQFPLAIEFYATLDLLKLPKKQQQEQIKISLKDMTSNDKELSGFLHKTQFMELGYARCLQQQDLSKLVDVFTEIWDVCWIPQVDSRLLELSLYGATVDAVVRALLLEQIEEKKDHPNLIVPLLFHLLKMRIMEQLDSVIVALKESIETSASFSDLADAFTQLVTYVQYCRLRSIAAQEIEDLLSDCFKRTCFLMPSIAAEDQNQIGGIISQLYALIESALTYSDDLDFELLIQMAHATIIQAPNHALRGALTGILSKIKAISRTEITRQIRDYAISQDNEKDKVGDFLYGLLRVSQNLMTDNLIFEAINHVVCAPDPPSFLKLLPGLKRCFADLSATEKNVLIRKVKTLGSKPKKSSLVKKNFVVDVAFLQEIEQEAVQILEEWNI